VPLAASLLRPTPGCNGQRGVILEARAPFTMRKGPFVLEIQDTLRVHVPEGIDVLIVSDSHLGEGPRADDMLDSIIELARPFHRGDLSIRLTKLSPMSVIEEPTQPGKTTPGRKAAARANWRRKHRHFVTEHDDFDSGRQKSHPGR
jgi:hypothetical protein